MPEVGRLSSRLRFGSGEGADADFPEPHVVARVVILQPKITCLRSLWLALWLGPTLSRWNIRALGIESCHALAVEIHQHPLAGQSNDHGPPLAGFFLPRRGGE